MKVPYPHFLFAPERAFKATGLCSTLNRRYKLDVLIENRTQIRALGNVETLNGWPCRARNVGVLRETHPSRHKVVLVVDIPEQRHVVVVETLWVRRMGQEAHDEDPFRMHADLDVREQSRRPTVGQLAVFDLLQKDSLTKSERDAIKKVAKDLLGKLSDQRFALDRLRTMATVQAQMVALKLTTINLGSMVGDLGRAGAYNDRRVERMVVGGSGSFDAADTTWTWDAYGQSEARTRLGPPTARAIDQMDCTLPWLRWLDGDDQKLVWERANGRRWKAIAGTRGIDRSTAWRRWSYAVHVIAARLNVGAEPPTTTAMANTCQAVGGRLLNRTPSDRGRLA